MKHLLAIFAFLLPLLGAGQFADPCFYSVPASSGFANSSDLAGSPSNGPDMAKYENGSWSGANGAGLSIEPPINCDAVKAIFIRSQSGTNEGIGFRLTTPLVNGPVSLPFTYVSHGAGSNGTFSPLVYACPDPILFDNGVLQGTLLGSLQPAGTTWLTANFNFNSNNAIAGYDWIFVLADGASGLILNNCQLAAGELILNMPTTIDICDGETATLGDPSLNGADNIIWNFGGSNATVQVSTTGYFSVSASNVCNSVSGGTLVTVHTEPELVPDGDTTLCSGSQIELSPIGLNPVANWPDGSTEPTYFITAPGEYNITITDDCATVVRTVNVSLDSIPYINLGIDTSLCYNEPHVLNALIDYPGATYLWNTGSEDPLIDVVLNESSTYSVAVTNLCGTGSDAIYVEYSLRPEDVLAGSYEICFGRQLILDASAVEGDYEWRDGTTAPTLPVPSPGYYWVTIEDDDGCWVVSDTTQVFELECTCPMFLPNSFTPNGDGLNDEFFPVFECAPYDYQLDIFNRWGVKIATINDPSIGWNGKQSGEPMEDGVYAYRLQYSEVFAGFLIIKTGHIVLMQMGRE